MDGKKNVICVFRFCIFFMCTRTKFDVETSFFLFTFLGVFSYLCNYTYRQHYRFFVSGTFDLFDGHFDTVKF